MKQFIGILTGLIIFSFFLLPFSILAANFSGDHKWAWGENIGWNNFQPTHEGVTVAGAGLTGYLWAENVGWIKLDYDGVAGATNTTSTNWGVTNDGSGNLGGYAWGENIGWVNFDSTHSQVTITNAGNFSGYAWAENVGWIKFDHTQTDYTPRTSWFFVIGPGMASTSYKITSSDINAGGRDDQTSTTYKMKDTIGGIATGISESALYKLMAGYRTIDDLTISFSISDLAIGFGTFSSTNSRWATSDETAGATSEPAAQNPTYITISTNAPNGVIISARSKGSGTGVEGNDLAGLYKSSSPIKLIAATACTTVADGTESYALYVKNVGTNLTAASGFNGGTCTGTISITNQTILTASVALTTNNTADVALKAAITSTTLASSSYTDVITLTGTGKF